MQLEKIFEKLPEEHDTVFAEIYEETIDRMYRFVLLRTKSKESSLDICQDVFVDLYLTLASFKYESDAAFYKYLFTIARRKIYKYRKSFKTTVPLEEILELADKEVEIDDVRYLEREISKLSDKEKCVIENRYFGGFKFSEVSVLCKISENNAKVVHSRAVKKLRSMLGGAKDALY